MRRAGLTILVTAALFLPGALLLAAAQGTAEGDLLRQLRESRPYTLVPPDTFNGLGWSLPDGGATVKRLADAIPGGAFDPAALERLDAKRLGYRATWHVLRYRYYGLDWDITGLLLTPNAPVAHLPTVALINGGSANFYEFFVDPLNGPAVAQYLAQRVPVLLITIPGNYKPGGWTEPPAQRKAAYLLDRTLPDAEASARNAIYTFTLVTEGVAQLIERTTKGPILISGHSTGGEIQFLLKDRLASRLRGYSLGWGTGGPASVRRTWNDDAAGERNRTSGRRQYPPLTVLRPRTAQEYARSYVGPLNPLGPGTPEEIAERWFAREDRRRPQFKQVLQDLEHQGEFERRDEAAAQIRTALDAARMNVDAEAVIRDLFSTAKAPIAGYSRMIWTTALQDDGHWDEDPARARELFVAEAFREANPGKEIRVLVFGVPMSHYGHIERPRELAGGLLAAVKWLYEGR
ncbi:MAG TPA: hypothetical protein VM364_20635 [Vicinamibacterales bacterium]|nr:hypothetical protein [Vicinamibacterales bacterium]